MDVFLFWCGRRDSNPHGRPHGPEPCASANSATTAYLIVPRLSGTIIIIQHVFRNCNENFAIFLSFLRFFSADRDSLLFEAAVHAPAHQRVDDRKQRNKEDNSKNTGNLAAHDDRQQGPERRQTYRGTNDLRINDMPPSLGFSTIFFGSSKKR